MTRPNDTNAGHETVTPGRIHHVITVLADAQTASRALATCPRRSNDAVDVRECVSCVHARGFIGSPTGQSNLLSTKDRAPTFVLCHTDIGLPSAAAPGTVGSCMSRDVICVRDDMLVDQIVWLFLKRGVSGLPVLDAENRVRGVVSKTDIIRAYAQGRLRTGESLDTFDTLTPGQPWACTVRDVMSAPALTVGEHDPLTHAAELMSARSMHRLPVVSASGVIVGVISSLDLFKAPSCA